jgi:regulator of protease activity HflC (stomatin/prohibitin superfamily)
MYVSSKFAIGPVLAIAFAIALWSFGTSTLQAKTAQHTCAPTVTQTCVVDTHAQHEAEEARQRAEAKAEKEARHAQHEAEEARARAQKEAEHAQHEAAEECERLQKAYAHALHEAEEAKQKAMDKQAKVDELAGMCKTCGIR